MSAPNAGRRAESDGLRLAGVLLVAGVVVSAGAGALHAEGVDPNDHPAVFAVYAASRSWTAVHLGQFVGMLLITVGLVALHHALGAGSGGSWWLSRFGLLLAGVALAVYAVLQAVDGVALKQAVDAWASERGPDQATRFAAAETVRWTEWAVRSYHSFTFGLALVLSGAAVAGQRVVARPIGYLMALSGLCYLAQGWIIGTTGFSPANAVPTLLGIVLVVVWTVWLLVVGIRAHRSSGTGPARRSGQP